ncbi:MAG: response regulator transcription factor [Planctomycetes bacterium]|nr:response regulator transcription factor [Planctomycetota bacterium]
MRVLLIEDYQPLRRSLEQGLREAGFSVDASADGEEGLWFATTNAYDAIILDLMLPKLDGLTVLERLRSAGNRTPVLILTARDSVDDRVRGLDHGADDYLTKPFALAELLARLRVMVRRGYSRPETVLTVGHLTLDTAARTVAVAGETIPLTAKEYALLELLARRSGELVSRSDIVEHCYDFAAEAASNVIDVYIGYLRRKLERPDRPRLIHTRRGQGYLLGNEH